MNNADNISLEVYIHSPSNPPLPDRSVDAEICIKNSKHIVLSNWAKNSQQTQYTLQIKEPKGIGLSSTTQTHIMEFVDHLLLSINLHLKSGDFLIHRADMTTARIELKKQTPEPTTIKRNGNHTTVIFHETLVHTDTYHLTMGFREEIDESHILYTLEKILKLQNLKFHSSLNVQNFRKSLEEYKIAMANFNRLGIFKHLFNSVELATNCDKKDRSGVALDLEVSSLASISNNIAKDWREFYARTKHIDKDSSDEAKYIQGMNELPGKIQPLREATQTIIFSRISSIT